MSYLEAVDRVTGLLREQDEVGRWWTRGRLVACNALVERDRRLAFCRALPRSALFGETIVASGYQAIVGDEPPEAAKEAGRLVNMFVTTLDGLCDEAPDLLPEIVPATNDLFTSFPEVPAVQPGGRHPVVWLTYEVGVSVSSILRERLRQPGTMRFKDRLAAAVRSAYSAELDSLKLLSGLETSEGVGPGKVVEERTRLSASTFNASLQIAALFAESDERVSAQLERAASLLGAFFGWVDDVVDLESDRIQHKPNMVAARLIEAGCELGAADLTPGRWRKVVAEETQGRWRALCGVLRELPRGEVLENALRRAALAWLGFGTLKGSV